MEGQMATTKLTDAQRVILAAAAARDSGLVLPLPQSLGNNRGTLGVILKSLLTRGLITERPILPDEDLWRDTAELGRTTLVISVEGLTLMGIDPIDHVVHKDAEGKIVTDDGGISPDRRRPAVHLDTGIETPDPNPPAAICYPRTNACPASVGFHALHTECLCSSS